MNGGLLALEFVSSIISAVSAAVRRGVKPEAILVHIEGLRPAVEKIDAAVDAEGGSDAR